MKLDNFLTSCSFLSLYIFFLSIFFIKWPSKISFSISLLIINLLVISFSYSKVYLINKLSFNEISLFSSNNFKSKILFISLLYLDNNSSVSKINLLVLILLILLILKALFKLIENIFLIFLNKHINSSSNDLKSLTNFLKILFEYKYKVLKYKHL
jgi:hypothetical protein